MKRSLFVFAAGISLALPVLVSAKDEFDGLLARVPAPPATTGAAMLRYQEGHDENGSQVGFDKAAVELLAQIDKEEKSQMTSGLKFGGESVEDMTAKMQTMSKEEQMAYVMKLSAKMKSDQINAYKGGDGKAMMQVTQNNNASVHKSMAVETAAKAMFDIDADFQTQFDALLTDMLASVNACPRQTVGQASGPAPSCVKPILAKYRSDYDALAVKKMAKYTKMYIVFKKSVVGEVASWQKDIDSLKGATSDVAANDVNRKKLLIYEDIKGLAVPADKMVQMGHDAATLDPAKACGGDCLQD